jgi:predicted Zn-dependent protease
VLLGLATLLCRPRLAWAISILSEAQEAAIGREADREILRQLGRYENSELQAYVAEVGARLASEAESTSFRYQFKIVDRPEINAFALPGGYVYVHRGLLAELNSEAELAGVLGHELAHITKHHAAKAMTRNIGLQALTLGALIASPGGRQYAGQWATVMGALSQAMLRGWGRDNELEADEVGLHYAHAAGYDPGQMVPFLRSLRIKERLRGQGYHGPGATHPDMVERLVKVDALAELLRSRGGRLEVRDDEYKARLEGLPYGDRRDRKKLRIHTVEEGETARSIARAVLGDELRGWELALLNGVKEEARLRAGQKFKLIVA